jgi:DNA-binding CsgD family transcriptional regulator
MTALVGRTTEVATSVEVATGDSPDVAVLIVGAPGIGKTVILDAATEAARSAGAVVLQTRPSETEARMGLLGLHDLLAPLVPDVLRSLAPPQRARLEAALGINSGPAGSTVDEGQLAIAVLSLLRGLAARQRVVIAIDDLQWLDPSTGAVLDVALGRLRDSDVRLLATAREGTAEDGRLQLERIYRDRLARLRLGGLALGDLHRLLADRLGRPVPRPTLVRIHEITRGNPYHALELARSLGNRGPIADILDTVHPSDVDVLLRRRIEQLGSRALDIVGAVALSSRPSNETVARALGLSTAELDEGASPAIDADLIVAAGRGMSLAHPLVGSAARHVLGAGRTRALHRRLAAVVTDQDEAAVHLSLGSTAPDEDVASALEAAATRALARGATIDAIEQLDRTIELTPAVERDGLVRRRMLLARALVLAGDTRRAGTELDTLGVDAIPDPATRAEAVLLLGVVQRYLGEHRAAIARHEDALGWVQDGRTRARLHMRLAWLKERELGAALEHAEHALELLDREAAPLDYSFALLTGARVRLHLGLAADHEAISLGARLQEASAERDWNVSTTPIDWAIWMEDWEAARSLLDAGSRAAEDAGDETVVGALLRRRVELETWSGRLALASELVETALEQAESTQQLPAIASARARRALIRAQQGDLDAAEREATEALEMAEAFATPPIIGYATAAMAAAAGARGDLDRVDTVASRATALFDETGDIDHSAHRYDSNHLDALVGLGQLDRARALADRLHRRGELGPRPTWSGVAARGYAGIALAEGRLDAARDHIAQALVFHDARTVPVETARTFVVAADVERRQGRRKAAAANLGVALEVLEGIGAAGMATSVRADLQRLGWNRAERHALTPSEERIARLASEGLRNREIAARMAISEKTVEAALGRAYEKLQIRSRAQLGAALHVLAGPDS